MRILLHIVTGFIGACWALLGGLMLLQSPRIRKVLQAPPLPDFSEDWQAEDPTIPDAEDEDTLVCRKPEPGAYPVTRPGPFDGLEDWEIRNRIRAGFRRGC